MSTNLSRRGFLAGAVATAAAVTLPAVAAPMENPCKAVIFPDAQPAFLLPDKDCYYHWYLHPAQWKFFEAEGMDMSQCRLIMPIPYGDILTEQARRDSGGAPPQRLRTAMNDKRSDFPCPGIVRSGNRSTSQNEQTRSIAEHFERRNERHNSPKAREINERNNDYLATKRRKMTKSIRKPK